MSDLGRRILVVEDEEHVRGLVQKLLSAAGYSVVSTGDPTQAAELARREAPELVLCDITMPVLDGYGVLQALQSDPATARVPVVFLTARREFGERVRAFRFGVVDYLTKPFTREILIRKVEKVLAGLRERPGVRTEGGEEPVRELLEDVAREARSGVLTVAHEGGAGRAIIEGGRVVETTIPPGRPARAEFRELDLDREHIVSHDPPRLAGDPAPVARFEALPEVFRSVLIVDDNGAFRAYLRDVLTRGGFTVHEAGDGEEALRIALEARPWLILTDVDMPVLDGLELCRRVRTHSLIRHTPLIFLSGWDDYKDRYRGLEAGADEYLSKDTSVRELLIRMQIVLKRYVDLGPRPFRGPGLEGRLEVIGVPGVLQMCHLGRLTGSLGLGSGSRAGEVRFRDGEIVSAQAEDRTGDEAVLALLSWGEGRFSFAPGEPGPGAPIGSFDQVLLDACRRLDESRREDGRSGSGD
ncbi:MAG TPA: response regulator [Vicinamibacteria bacterium]|nr:response regulator [Vicinamibacteria bacterium]